MQINSSGKAIEVKISTVVAVVISISDADPVRMEEALRAMTAGSPDYFDDELAVIDVAAVSGQQPDWTAMLALLRRYGLHVVAVRNASDDEEAVLRELGLSIDIVSKSRSEHVAEVSSEITQAPATPEPAPAQEPQIVYRSQPAMVIDHPVRAGQRIYARGGDLIIMAAVNNGAEVIADGSIHIYAPLRGRALAGATGDTQARIFARIMEPELVSIAGIYRTFENGFPDLPGNTPVQVKLQGDSIELSAVSSAS
ncbi:septum site-determining protein MinC [Undibacterium squillarum]|uniref:Probable septum site-determining protein MinC n=1 Tax=Undibacterium squillarum TaxID=1131567 RepID=A0ABQ2Y1Q4_9BURK|nr:septum site-determining protein MinC [Undibacterium squillarum]GGX52213.1 hypothetical protein GCM10010946_33550 [Undibacterium squillarum]